MTELVHSLKGGGRLGVFQKIAPLWPFPRQRQTLYFPDSGRKDHAWELAQSIVMRQGGQTQGLRKVNTGKQALLLRPQRKTVRFESLQSTPSGDAVFWVDDILTTGSTALACWQALRRPSYMAAYTIFFRNPSI